MEKTLGGKQISVTEEGYLTDLSQWDKAVAEDIAKEEGVKLTPKHFEVLEFLQKEKEAGTSISIRTIKKSGVVDVKEFYAMFPGAPLKKATKISGILKPTSCV